MLRTANGHVMVSVISNMRIALRSHSTASFLSALSCLAYAVLIGGMLLVTVLLLVPVKPMETLHDEPSVLTRSQAHLWSVIGDWQFSQQDYPAAASAYRKSFAVTWQQPDTVRQFTEALIHSHDGAFTAETENLAQLLLSSRPDDAYALWVNAVAAVQKQDHKRAITLLSRLLLQLPSRSADHQHVMKKIRELENAQLATGESVQSGGRLTLDWLFPLTKESPVVGQTP